jgi:DNA modification methylase
MVDKVFAPDTAINDKGWYLFPRDVEFRRQYFTEESMKHPARANLWLVKAIIEYVSEPGETLLDIMSGSGSLLIGTLFNRNVVLIEIEEQYQNLIYSNIAYMNSIVPGVEDKAMLIPGDANLVLPLTDIDHIIFSPPYAQIMRMSNPTGIQKEQYGDEGAIYQQSEGNVGRLNTWLYNQQMEKIYIKCFQTLRPGGTMTVIIKDFIKDQKRQFISNWVEKVCLRAGFEMKDWFKWDAPGTFFHSMRKARGENVVDEEEIIIVRKPV